MPQPLDEFLKEKGFNIPSTATLPTIKTTPTVIPPIDTKVTPLDVIKEIPSTTGKGLRWIGTQFMKPVSSVAVATEQIGKTIGTGNFNELKQIPKKVTDIFTSKTERSFSDIWRENLPEHQTAGTIIGTIIDIAADPLNFTGGGIAKGISKAGKVLAKTPGVEGALELTKPLFSTATHNKEFDNLLQHYRDLGDFKRANMIEKAKNIQKQVSKLKPDEIIQVSNKIEKGIEATNPVVNKLADNLKNTYKEWKTVEKEMGIKGGEIAQYVPHIPVSKIERQGQGIMGIAREFTSKLGGTEKHRSILKFVNESGEELIGKAENLGLKAVKGAENTFKDSTGKLFKAEQASIDEVNKAFEIKFFEENPAIQVAYRGLGHAKAVTSKEFLEGAKKFATNGLGDVASTAPELKGLKFAPDIAKQIDTYYNKIKPEEIKAVFKLYDNVLNWWKAQVLLGVSYHSRNFASNLWNNFLAGVTNPADYIQAGLLQKGKKVKFVDKLGKEWTEKELVNSAKRTGVINEGWFAADIPTAINTEISKGTWNPISQKFVAFKLNKKVGTALENNARLALFIKKIKEGNSIDNAAMTVKKFLFDYGDLTEFEKSWMKRIFPFYTWTRKNIPLQLAEMTKQPGKFVGLEKVVKAIENISIGDAKPANEKYLSDYIKSNTAMKVGYDEDEKIYYYFLAGNWIASYQAIDFLSQPASSFVEMLTPILKVPIERLVNQSLFFKNTLGDYQDIEHYPGETTNYLGFNMPKKTAAIIRNIRILNELDKLNPGKIFGGKKGETSIWNKAKIPAFTLPELGTISPALEKYRKTEAAPSATARTLGLALGKLQNYKESSARNFYQMDTDKRIDELKRQIKASAKKGDKKRIKILNEQLRKFIKERGR